MGESKSGIATASWHLNIPKDFQNSNIGDRINADLCTFGTDSNFILENFIIEGTKEKQFLDKEKKFSSTKYRFLNYQGCPSGSSTSTSSSTALKSL